MSNHCAAIAEMVWAIVKANRDPSSPVYKKALSKLTTISIDHWDTENGENINICTSFTALPSARSVRGRMVSGEADVDYNDNPIEQIQIEEIKILYSAVDSTSFEPILKLTKNLKSFTYEHEGANIGDAEYECLDIIALLREFARHSLQHLDLTCDMGHNEEDQAVGDLKDFNVLRVLRLNAAAFCRHQESWDASDEECVSLADTLPTSVQVITLVGWFQDNGPMQFLGGLAEERHKLPELTRICLEGNWNIPKDLVDTFKSVGIDLVKSESAIAY
ncbi:MAG: hypothetical protein Q9226_008690 [Calogaya cf. arnoldii]